MDKDEGQWIDIKQHFKNTLKENYNRVLDEFSELLDLYPDSIFRLARQIDEIHDEIEADIMIDALKYLQGEFMNWMPFQNLISTIITYLGKYKHDQTAKLLEDINTKIKMKL